MYTQKGPMPAIKILDTYFLENRARILEIAAFLDRIDRAEDREEGKKDFRYEAFMNALGSLLNPGSNRTKTIQLGFSDPTTEPIESAEGLKAVGAWKSPA